MRPSQLPDLPDAGRYPVMEGAEEEAVVDRMWSDEGGMVQDLQQLNLQDPIPGQEEPANQVPEAHEPHFGEQYAEDSGEEPSTRRGNATPSRKYTLV